MARAADLTFGWRWIARSIMIRRFAVLLILLMTAVIYAVGLAFPISTQWAVDAIVSGQAGGELFAFALIAVLAILLEAWMTQARAKRVTDLVSFLDRRISRRIFAHLMRVRIDGKGFRSGDMLNHFQEAQKISDVCLNQLHMIVFDIGAAIVALLAIAYYDLTIGVVLVVVVALLTAAFRGEWGRVDSLYETFHAASGKRRAFLSETVNGLGALKSLVVENRRIRRWEEAVRAVLDGQRALKLASSAVIQRAQVVSRALSLLVIGLGCWRLYEGALTVGELLALQLLASRVTVPILFLGHVVTKVREAQIAIRRIANFLAQPREEAAITPPMRQFRDGRILFEGLSYTYPGGARPALEEVAATLPMSGLVAIVGRNGSGKSTLVRILLGLLRDYGGRVEIGGHDLRHYDPRWLRRRMGVADQETVLFSGTVRDNLAGGAHVDDAFLGETLRRVGALDFVEALPGGLDGELAEGGRSLSGGQRQRLSIARALVRRPAILILDEPTAFFDAEAALALETEIVQWRPREQLVILVSHHLAATSRADRVLVLDDGRLVGDGSHRDLLQTVPVYEKLWADYRCSLTEIEAI